MRDFGVEGSVGLRSGYSSDKPLLLDFDHGSKAASEKAPRTDGNMLNTSCGGASCISLPREMDAQTQLNFTSPKGLICGWLHRDFSWWFVGPEKVWETRLLTFRARVSPRINLIPQSIWSSLCFFRVFRRIDRNCRRHFLPSLLFCDFITVLAEFHGNPLFWELLSGVVRAFGFVRQNCRLFLQTLERWSPFQKPLKV